MTAGLAAIEKLSPPLLEESREVLRGKALLLVLLSPPPRAVGEKDRGLPSPLFTARVETRARRAGDSFSGSVELFGPFKDLQVIFPAPRCVTVM